jgi:hypothetical protein
MTVQGLRVAAEGRWHDCERSATTPQSNTSELQLIRLASDKWRRAAE